MDLWIAAASQQHANNAPVNQGYQRTMQLSFRHTNIVPRKCQLQQQLWFDNQLRDYSPMFYQWIS